MTEIKTVYHNRLPHIAPIGACFFVTFRLADSLPQSIVEELRSKMDMSINKLLKEQKTEYKSLIENQKKTYIKDFHHQLDNKPYGECYLNWPEIAQIIKDKLHLFDHDKYELISYCIMPNHVHIHIDLSIQVVDNEGFIFSKTPEDYIQLHQIMKRIKGSSAFEANKVLGRKGSFWHKDSYDHYVRNEDSFHNIINYIIQNPVKAGLVQEWSEFPNTYLKPH